MTDFALCRFFCLNALMALSLGIGPRPAIILSFVWSKRLHLKTVFGVVKTAVFSVKRDGLIYRAPDENRLRLILQNFCG